MVPANRLASLLARLTPAPPPQACFALNGLGEHEARSEGWRVGVLSASWNPPTKAHLRLCAQSAREHKLDEVVLVLAKSNVDKAVEGASLVQRLQMLTALQQAEVLDPDNEGGNVGRRVVVSVVATNCGRFVDKLHALRTLYPAHVRLFFVMGFDTLTRLFDPKYYPDSSLHAVMDELFSRAEVIAFNRGDADASAVHAFCQRPDVRHFAPSVHICTSGGDTPAISSTKVRESVVSGNADAAAQVLVPSVLAFIQQEGLFRDC